MDTYGGSIGPCCCGGVCHSVAQAIMRFMGAIGVAPDVTTYKKLALGCRRSSDGLQLLKEMKVSRSHKPLRLGTHSVMCMG